ncbi:hypothetical protein PENTCL1PPCAC_9109, partial [Pristionchus entomophagus]
APRRLWKHAKLYDYLCRCKTLTCFFSVLFSSFSCVFLNSVSSVSLNFSVSVSRRSLFSFIVSLILNFSSLFSSKFSADEFSN